MKWNKQARHRKTNTAESCLCVKCKKVEVTETERRMVFIRVEGTEEDWGDVGQTIKHFSQEE